MRVEKGGGLFCFRSERRFCFILRRSDFLSDGLSKVVFKFFFSEKLFFISSLLPFFIHGTGKNIVLRSFSKIPKSRSSAFDFLKINEIKEFFSIGDEFDVLSSFCNKSEKSRREGQKQRQKGQISRRKKEI